MDITATTPTIISALKPAPQLQAGPREPSPVIPPSDVSADKATAQVPVSVEEQAIRAAFHAQLPIADLLSIVRDPADNVLPVAAI